MRSAVPRGPRPPSARAGRTGNSGIPPRGRDLRRDPDL